MVELAKEIDIERLDLAGKQSPGFEAEIGKLCPVLVRSFFLPVSQGICQKAAKVLQV